jgi:hypothetical protein
MGVSFVMTNFRLLDEISSLPVISKSSLARVLALCQQEEGFPLTFKESVFSQITVLLQLQFQSLFQE